MLFLIDGFNLIYKFPDLEENMYYNQLNSARIGLLNKLREYQNIKKTSIRVVFDGKKDKSVETTSERIGKIDVFYSLDYSADHLIKQFIKRDVNPKMTTVVTSDKDIIFYINRFGAKNITSEKFADMMKAAQLEFLEEQELQRVTAEKENPSVSEEEISYWQKVFKQGKK
ncbi:MAG: NYN domain-containing protein [Leptospirales bacterium]|nr:NYN domain-containing protein [Leptospirales bacterium]